MRRGALPKIPLGLLCLVGAFALKACVLPFDDYAEGDLCEAGRDAGVDLRIASDPVLRGCDAGPPVKGDDDANAGAGGGQ